LEKAQKYLERGLQIQKDIGIQAMISAYYAHIGLIHLDLKELDIAQEYFEKFLELSQKNNEKTIEGAAWISLGRVLGKKGPSEFIKAEEYIMKGVKMVSELKIRPHLSRGYLYLGDLYNQIGQKNEASKYLKKAEGMFKEMEMDYYIHKTQDAFIRL
ncbi:hypothetical protein ACFL1Z_06825, partial [Thermodesulfobacteriota bacterium]